MLIRDDGGPAKDVATTRVLADYRALFEASPTPFLVVAPPDWMIVAANDARVEVTGTRREDQVGRPLYEAFPDDPNDPTASGVRNLRASLDRVIATKAADTMAVQRYAVRDASGRFVERWWSPVNAPVLDSEGEVAFVIHRVEDVTEIVRLRGEAEAQDQLLRDQHAVIERLRATEAALRTREQHLRLMVDELNHRVKNTLATVQAIVAQTLRGVGAPEARDAITARLQALSRAHDVITDEHWAGAALREIARLAAEPYLGAEGSRFIIDGPDVTAPPRLAIALALTFHELATNAAKYGALSAPDGRVRIGWSLVSRDGHRFIELEWRETGGPKVSPSGRRGFGTRLIERSLAAEGGGTAELIFHPDGLVCRLCAEIPSPDAGLSGR